MSSQDEPASEASSETALSDELVTAAPDLTAEEHRRRKDLIRQRLLGGEPTKIGRFTLLREVGVGAMSVVYAVYDEKLDRRVAVKLLRAAAEPGDKRLEREAQAMARLAHPNVVTVYETGHWEGQLFIVMELVEGQTLDEWLDGRHRTWKEIVEVFLQAGRGLAAAHRQRLVHRDFKPTNVMVDEDGRARVLDFGLARMAREADASESRHEETPPSTPLPASFASLTATGACVGTPAYMAPEQRAGRGADERSDQYSFCKALHEALSGFRRGDGGTAIRGRRSALIRPRLWRVVERGLAEEPGARWPSMRHLLGELEKLRWPARRWRQRMAVLGMVALVVLVALAARYLVAREHRARNELERQAAHQRVLAHDARLVAAAQRLIESDPTAAAAALREVRYPARARGWRSTATAVLLEPLSGAAIRGLSVDCNRLMFDRGGRHVIAFLNTGEARSWHIDGAESPFGVRSEPGRSWIPSSDLAGLLSLQDGGWVLRRTDGSAPRALGAPGERVAGVSFHGGGPDVVTVSTAGTVRLWESDESRVVGTPPRELGIRDPSRWSFQLWPGGHHVIATAPSGERWRWPADGSRPAVRVRRHSGGWVRSQMLRRDRWLGVTFEDGSIELWDGASGTGPRVFPGHPQAVNDFDVSPDGRWLATASRDGTVRVWPMDGAGKPEVLRGHDASVSSIRFDSGDHANEQHPPGSLARHRVVTTSQDRTARVWSLDGSGDVMVLRGHAHHVGLAAFSPDGHRLATCGLEPSVRLWDLTRRPVRTLGKHDAKVWSARLDDRGERLVTAGHDGTARIWHFEGNRPPIVLRGHQAPGLYTASFSPDGSRVATGGADGTARIWLSDGSRSEPILTLAGHRGWVYGMAFSPDGRWLATGARDGEIRLSPLGEPGEPEYLADGCSARNARVHQLLFHPRGDRLATDLLGCQWLPALVWTGRDRRRVPLGPPKHGRVQLAMSPDGRIATGSKDGTLRVWAADGGGPLAVLHGHDAEIHDLAFSRDGRRLLSASFDRSARLWDLDRPGEPIILRGHEDWVLGAAFDRDERRVVTASADGTARVWRLDEPDQPIVLRGHRGQVRHAAFTCERQVVTAGFDGTVRLWNLDEMAVPPDALMEKLRRATSACLTADQRMQHLEEPAAVAAERFAACERAAGRGSAPPVP